MADTGQTVAIEAPGAAALANRLERWGGKLEDLKPAFELMLRYLNRGEAQIFDSQGAALGRGWAPAAEGSDGRLLVASGALRASLASQTGDSERVATATELRFGTTVPYGHFHQTGIPGRLPARPFIGMPEATRTALANILQRYSEAAQRG